MRQSDLFEYLNNQDLSFNLPDVPDKDESSHVSKVIILPRNWTNLSEDELPKNIVKSNPKEVEQEVSEMLKKSYEHRELNIGASSTKSSPYKLPRNWRELSKEELENEIRTVSMKREESREMIKIQVKNQDNFHVN